MTHPLETTILDFDYTVADSSQGAVECIRYALERLDLPSVSDESARRTIGLSLPDTFHELTGRLPGVQSNAFARLFIERAEQVMADCTVLLGPVPAAIAQLVAGGITLGIVSNKYRLRIEHILRREKLLDAFSAIVGGEDVVAHKPDPEGLLKAMALLGSTPAGTIYVGDSVTDAQTAERAGVPFVAVLSGVTPRDAFVGYEVHKVIDDLSGLCDVVLSGRGG